MQLTLLQNSGRSTDEKRISCHLTTTRKSCMVSDRFFHSLTCRRYRITLMKPRKAERLWKYCKLRCYGWPIWKNGFLRREACNSALLYLKSLVLLFIQNEAFLLFHKADRHLNLCMLAFVLNFSRSGFYCK